MSLSRTRNSEAMNEEIEIFDYINTQNFCMTKTPCTNVNNKELPQLNLYTSGKITQEGVRSK